jgi:hypothetical protein
VERCSSYWPCKEQRPPSLLVWERIDPFFTAEGAKAYSSDLPKQSFARSMQATLRVKKRTSSSQIASENLSVA